MRMNFWSEEEPKAKKSEGPKAKRLEEPKAKKLEGLKGISGIEKLESDHYAEKYLVRITQPVDHKNPAAGTFTQRVIVAHVGFDRPTI